MKLLLVGRVGRKDRRRSGGIARSAQLICQTLRAVGDEVLTHNIRVPLESVPDGVDLVWYYGDFKAVGATLLAARKAGVPVLINSTYDAKIDRSKWIVDQYRKVWDRHQRGDVFVGVFTEEARRDPYLGPIASQVVAVPKTVRVGEFEVPGFQGRKGICVGELTKTTVARYTRGMDVHKCLEKLRKGLPEAELWAYAQYRPDGAPEGVHVAPKMKHGFLEWLSQFRLFISLVRHETFAMVPLEAQSVGTPVFYRHMPQSLSSYIGSSGFVFDDPEELLDGALTLYRNQPMWEAASRASVLNAQSRSVGHVGPLLHLALRKVLLRKA